MEPSPTYTVSGIVRHLAEHGFVPNIPSTVNQLRHFSNHGLLRPVGHVHTGTGRNRYFEPSEIIRGAILVNLARFDTSIGPLRYLMGELDKSVAKRQKSGTLISVAKTSKDLWVAFLVEDSNPGELKAHVELIDGASPLAKLKHPGMVIGLSRLVSRLGL